MVPLVEEEEEGSEVGLVVVEDLVEDLVEEEASGDVEDVVVGGEGLIDSGLVFVYQLTLVACTNVFSCSAGKTGGTTGTGPTDVWNGLAHLLACCTMHLCFVHFKPLWVIF